MKEIKDHSVDLVIYDPPYTNSPDRTCLDKREYISFLNKTATECERVLSNEGILVTINTDLRDHRRYNQNNKTFDGLIWHKHSVIKSIFEGQGFLCFDTKLWVKSLKQNVYRYNYSYIQLFKKSSKKEKIRIPTEISKEYNPDVWLLPGTPRIRITINRIFRDSLHPVLVYRCIYALSKGNAVVLSPFAGVGTVTEISHSLGRNSIGYEIDKDLYKHLAEKLPYADLII
jgi:DNA modification methylase